MSCERRGRRRPAGRCGPSALFMAHRCAARERNPASGHSQSHSQAHSQSHIQSQDIEQDTQRGAGLSACAVPRFGRRDRRAAGRPARGARNRTTEHGGA